MKLSSLTKFSPLLAMLALGCGEDEKSIYSSGLDDEKTASTLDDDEKRQFCRSFDSHVSVSVGFQELARVLCLPAALLTRTREGCQEVLDTCSRNAASPITVDVRRSREEQCFDDLDSCEADVGTLESCVNVNIGLARSVLESITCAKAGDPDAMREVNQVMQTAGTCARASASCGEATQVVVF